MILTHTSESGLTLHHLEGWDGARHVSVWKHRDSDGRGVGPSYPTKAEALADTNNYAVRAGWIASHKQEESSQDTRSNPFAADVAGVAWALGDPKTDRHWAAETLWRIARESEVGPTWRPIETAPKDELVLVGPTKRMGICAAMNDSRDGWVTETCSEWINIYTPTHWMPLPPPPVDKEQT